MSCIFRRYPNFTLAGLWGGALDEKVCLEIVESLQEEMSMPQLQVGITFSQATPEGLWVTPVAAAAAVSVSVAPLCHHVDRRRMTAGKCREARGLTMEGSKIRTDDT